ncbi:MAG: VC0807 family protein [Bdellovibrionales bacterium]
MKPTPPPENPLLSLVVNILIPVMILNKGSHFISSQLTLLVALCFPLVYGIQDYVRRKHKNYVSLVGLVNILLTGSLALMSLNGIWFAFKEATLPSVLGCLVLFSAWTKNPAAKILFCNPHVLNMELIEERLATLARESVFLKILKQTTLWLSLSFFTSAAANFTLALGIFKDIDPKLANEEQMSILNAQLAHMTWLGFGVVALPLMVFSGILIYVFLHRVSKLIDVPVDSLMKA